MFTKTQFMPFAASTTEAETALPGDLHQDVKTRFHNYMNSTGLKKPLRWALYRQYKFPINAKLTKAPVLNKAIATVLTESCKDRDDQIRERQDELGHALAALGEAMNGLQNKTSSDDIPPAVVMALADAAKLISDVHVEYTRLRRNRIIPLVSTNYTDVLSQLCVRDSDYLFSESLTNATQNASKGQFSLVEPQVECSSGCVVGKNSLYRRGKTTPIFGCGKAKVFLNQKPLTNGVTLSRITQVFKSTKGTPKVTRSYLSIIKVQPPTEVPN